MARHLAYHRFVTLLGNCGTGSGGFKSGNSCGKKSRALPDFTQPTASAPRRMDAGKAHAALERSFAVKDRDRSVVTFGGHLLHHLAGKNDEAARKAYLPWAIETVKRTRGWESGDKRFYLKSFNSHGKAKGFLVIVGTRHGEVFTIHRRSIGSLKKTLAEVFTASQSG
jgi:hypothetical protein